jgi:hypothetical protein
MPTGPPTPRTNSTLVGDIVEVDPTVDLSSFIAASNQLVTGLCSNSGYTDGFVGSQMEVIERWLAAHMYTINDNQLISARAGSAAVTFQNVIGPGLATSMYGQNAMLLDFMGNLARWNNSARIKRQIRISMGSAPSASRRRGWYGGYGQGDAHFGVGWADLTVEQ